MTEWLMSGGLLFKGASVPVACQSVCDRGLCPWVLRREPSVRCLDQGASDPGDYVPGSFALEGFGLNGLCQRAFKG